MTPTVPGSIHDKKDLDQNRIVENIPDEIPIEVDLGYKGLEKEFPGINIPHKRRRKMELTDEQKQANKELASTRIVVEHVIGSAKRYDCLVQTYRNRRDNFEDRLMITCAGLANFYQRTGSAA